MAHCDRQSVLPFDAEAEPALQEQPAVGLPQRGVQEDRQPTAVVHAVARGIQVDVPLPVGSEVPRRDDLAWSKLLDEAFDVLDHPLHPLPSLLRDLGLQLWLVDVENFELVDLDLKRELAVDGLSGIIFGHVPDQSVFQAEDLVGFDEFVESECVGSATECFVQGFCHCWSFHDSPFLLLVLVLLWHLDGDRDPGFDLVSVSIFQANIGDKETHVVGRGKPSGIE
mmetsp:Transcript_2574/g.5928  ORF Transcript_2574/g.5928 Transcript_2574/m.5928 type:complete len:225 (+) Transcript_2574:2021-2695(+)